VRRGYFVAGLGAAQFAQPGAVDLLRAERDRPDAPEAVTLASTDPANPYGAIVPWPAWPITGAGAVASRSAGTRVVLVDGACAAWIAKSDRQLLVALPGDDPDRSRVGRALVRALVAAAPEGADGRKGWLIAEINHDPAQSHPAAPFFYEAGFTASGGGLHLRAARPSPRN
jgi:ATP-dependent Lhr-like helicase